MSGRALPPLRTLEAFAIAAEEQSFRLAAQRMNLTASAISHQVRTLERALGVELFERQPRAVRLTEAGCRYHADISELLDRLMEATYRVRAHHANNRLTITASPSDASNWLIPRLESFRKDAPELEIRLDTSTDMIDLQRSDIDVAIRSLVAPPADPWLVAHHLYDEELILICAPKTRAQLQEKEGLASFTLLRSLTNSTAWQIWGKAIGMSFPFDTDTLELPNDTVVIEAAAHGLGIGLVHRAAAANALASGRLVQPLAESAPSRRACYLVHLKARIDAPAIIRFRNWILTEIGGITAQ